MATTADPDAPLWRAASAFRLLTVVYAVGYQVSVASNLRSPQLAWALVATLVVWSGLAGTLVLGRATRRWVVIADQAVVLLLVASTRAVSDADWYSAHQVLPTTLWVTNAVIGAAIAWGPRGGLASGLVMTIAIALVRGDPIADAWRDATGPVLLSVGFALGVASNAARRGQRRLEAAVSQAAASRERERLAREVHDGVLQVLAMVSRRGREIGGAATELADLASQQEVALRTLVSGARESAMQAHGSVDLAAALQLLTSVTVSVSAPGGRVPVDAVVAGEIVAATTSALANVELHAGAGVKAFVLLEQLPDAVIVSVRDDGIGIDAARLVAAEVEGRMGVSKSIVGRIHDIGGTAVMQSTPGEGTEWELRIPLAHNTPGVK